MPYSRNSVDPLAVHPSKRPDVIQVELLGRYDSTGTYWSARVPVIGQRLVAFGLSKLQAVKNLVDKPAVDAILADEVLIVEVAR